ncbi:MAG TPA: hypothetical protein VHB51_00105 [Candidatus Saccharimonadales bacterium]|nr:hypothetical protein [Candidatus Saccharimonadales bacterium]
MEQAGSTMASSRKPARVIAGAFLLMGSFMSAEAVFSSNEIQQKVEAICAAFDYCGLWASVVYLDRQNRRTDRLDLPTAEHK